MPLGAFKAALMGTAGVTTVTGDVVLLNTTTITSDTAGVTWNSSIITSTYSQYLIKCYNVEGTTNDTALVGQLSIDNGSNWNVATTTQFFTASHTEAGTGALSYQAGYDHAAATGWLYYMYKIGNAGDESGVMSMQLFNPSSTTYVKHFLIEGQQYDGGNASVHNFVSGYADTTTAVNAMHIKAASGSIANGVFKIWGVK